MNYLSSSVTSVLHGQTNSVFSSLHRCSYKGLPSHGPAHSVVSRLFCIPLLRWICERSTNFDLFLFICRVYCEPDGFVSLFTVSVTAYFGS